MRYLKLERLYNDTISGIAILDTTAIPKMRYAISMSFRIRQSQTSQTIAIATTKNMCPLVNSQYTVSRDYGAIQPVCQRDLHICIHRTMSGRGKGGNVKGKANSRSSRAGLQFLVGRSLYRSLFVVF